MMKTGEVARELEVSVQTIRNWVAQGVLKSKKTLVGGNRFQSEDVQSLKRKLITRLESRQEAKAESAL